MVALVSLLALVFVEAVSAQNAPPYTTHWHKQRLDHFDPQDTGSFKQRYLRYNGSFNASKNLIFFYAGNEGPVDGFYNNTGFMYVWICLPISLSIDDENVCLGLILLPENMERASLEH